MKLSIQHKTFLTLTALVVAWGFDFLFWGHQVGISFFIFVVLCILGGWAITLWEGYRPSPRSLLLLVPTLFFASVSFWRSEPLTVAVSVLLTLVSLSILVMTWRGGKWTLYSLSDYVVGLFQEALSALTRPVWLFFYSNAKKAPAAAQATAAETVLLAQAETPGAESTAEVAAAQPARKTPSPWIAVLRGVVLAIPVLAILAVLLANADPIFSQDLSAFLSLFRIQNLGMYIFRGTYILVGAYLLIGLYLHAVGPSWNEKLVGVEKPWLTPFLGWTEAIIVLGAVDLLFAFFVGIQARYFFGGQANINTAGYTFAEYARRGFDELVAVAVISLLLLLALSTITRRTTLIQRRVFTGLQIGLVLLVGVILVSAFQRLLLYEDAYGFSRIRIYTHIFMIWLGVLLVATAALEVANHLRQFALALFIVSLGFGLTLSLLNVDGYIVKENITRAQAGNSLDTDYLQTLSDDAIPAITAAYNTPSLATSLHTQLRQVMGCYAATYKDNATDTSWQSYNRSRMQARQSIAAFPASDQDTCLYLGD